MRTISTITRRRTEPTAPPTQHPAASPSDRPGWLPIISARSVTKTHRSGSVAVPVLRGVDLDVGVGEFVVIVGTSGSGKSTLLNCLSGLDHVDGGEVRFAGEDLHRLGERERTALRARSMGFVFQGFNLIPVLTAVENVELPALAGGRSSTATRRRATELLAAVDMAERADHRPRELSGGQQQRVAIARALMTDPAVIWADEPTGNLDRASADRVLERFEALHSAGRTIVMVTHDPQIAALADRCIEVVDGQVGETVR